MEQNKKYLRLTAFIILLLTLLSVVTLVTEIFFGELNNAEIPEGAPENTLLIAKIVVAVIAGLLLLPQLYVGIKGLSFAKKPDSSRAHIIWAKILLVLSILALISPISAVIKGNSVGQNVLEIVSTLAEVILFFDYVKFASALRK